MRQRIKENFRKKLAAALLAAALSFSLAGPALADSGRCVVPMGSAVGIELQTEGMLVAGLSPVTTETGTECPAEDAGLLPGDVILRLGGQDTLCPEALATALGSLDGEPVSVTVRRGGRLIQYTITPALGQGGVWQLGVWLRDHISGIGTLTYYDPATGSFGALGHAITDAQTGELVPLGGGVLTDAAIVDVRAGVSGTPGELCGVGDGSDKRGDIDQNTICGIFGQMTAGGMELREAIPVGDEADICLGEAVILSTVSGKEAREYAVEITRVYRNAGDCRSMMLTVTDPELLEKTGGIVQGMSGSPIIQNGRLIGAVTHVLVSDPARGYGVSIQNMLDACGAEKDAA